VAGCAAAVTLLWCAKRCAGVHRRWSGRAVHSRQFTAEQRRGVSPAGPGGRNFRPWWLLRAWSTFCF